TIEVGPVVSRFLARGGTLDVENHFRARVETCCRNVTAGFDEHLETFLAQAGNQIEAGFLCEWFAAGYFDQVDAKRAHLVHHGLDRDVLAARERVLAVAPDAAHGA